MSVVIAKNQTAAALSIGQIPIPDNEIPASGQATLSDYANMTEIQEDPQLTAYIAAGDVILNVDGTDLSAGDSASYATALSAATVAEVNTGTDGSKAVVPSSLAGSTLATNVTANNAKVSADGLVTTHSDVSSAGSGAIVTGLERTKLTGIEPSADVTDATNVAAAGALMTSLADAKGDLFVATANDTVIRLPVGTDTHVLTLDSAEASGVKWAAGGGGGTSPTYVDYYDAGTSNVGTSPTTLGLDTARQTDALFVLSADQVTVQSGGAGDYFVRYEVTFDESDATNRLCECWLEIDTGAGFSEISGTRSQFSHWSEHGLVTDNTAGRSAIPSLSDGDILRVRGEVITGTGNYTTSAGGVSLIIMSIGSTGPTGAQGAAGSGSTITVQDGGSTVSGGPHATLNFVGMSATDAGGSVATVAPIYGSEYESELDMTFRSTTGTSFFEAQKFTTASKPAGTYRIEFNYIWSYNAINSDFKCQVTVDDTTQLYAQTDGGDGSYDLHQQEPKDRDGTGDGGTNQRYVLSYWADVTFGSAGTHEIDIDIATSVGSIAASIHRSTIAIYRVS